MMRKAFRTAAALLLLLRTAVLPETEPEETAQTETVQETAEPEETPAEEPVEETVQEPEEPEEAPPEETAAEPEESTDPEEVPEPVITHGTYAPLFTYGHMTIRNNDRPKLRAGVVPEHTCFYWIPSIGRYIGLINNTAVCLKHNSPGGANVSAMGDLESLLYEQGYSEFGYLMKGGDRNAFIGMLYNPVPHDPEGFAALQVTVWGDDTLTGYPCDIFGRNIDYSTAVQIVPDTAPIVDPASVSFPMHYPGIANTGTPGVSGWINGSTGSSTDSVNILNDGHPDHDGEHTKDSGLTMYVDWDLPEKSGQFRVSLPAGRTFEEGGYEIITDPGLSCRWMTSRDSSAATIGCTVDRIWNQDKKLTLRATNNVKYVNGSPERTPDITADDMYRMMAASIPVYRAGSQPVSEGGNGSLKNVPYAYGSVVLHVRLYTADLDVRKLSEYGENVVPGQKFRIYIDEEPYAKDTADNELGDEDTVLLDTEVQNSSSAGTNGDRLFEVGFAPDGTSRLLSSGTGHPSLIHGLLPRTVQSDTAAIQYSFTAEPAKNAFTITDPAGRDILYEYASDPALLGTAQADTVQLHGGSAVVETEDREDVTYYYRASLPLGVDASGNLQTGTNTVYSRASGVPVQRTDSGLAMYEGERIVGCTEQPVLFSRDRTCSEGTVEGYAEPVYSPDGEILACTVQVQVPDNGVWYSAVTGEPDSAAAFNIRNAAQLQLYGTVGSGFALSKDRSHLNDAVLNGTHYDDVYYLEMTEENTTHLYTVDPYTGETRYEDTDGRVFEAPLPDVSMDEDAVWYYAGVDPATHRPEIRTGEVQIHPSHDPTVVRMEGRPGDRIFIRTEDDPAYAEEQTLVYDDQGEILLENLVPGAVYLYRRGESEQKRFYYVLEETETGDAYNANRKKETVDLPFWNVPDPATGSVCYAAGGDDGSPGTRIKEALCTVKIHEITNKELRTAIELTKYDVDSSRDGGITFADTLDNAFFMVKDVTFTVPGNGKLSPADPEQASARPQDTSAYAVPVFVGCTGRRWLQAVDPDNHERILPLHRIILVEKDRLKDGRVDPDTPYEMLWSDANGMICLDCLDRYRTVNSAYDATLSLQDDAQVPPERERLPAGTWIGIPAEHLGDAGAYAAQTHMVQYSVPESSEGKVFIDFLKYGHTYEITEYRLPEHTRYLNETAAAFERISGSTGQYRRRSARQTHYVTITSEADLSAYSDRLPENSGSTFTGANLPVYVYDSVKGTASNGNYVALEDPTHEYLAHRDPINLEEAESLSRKQRVNDGWTLIGDWSWDGSAAPNDGSFYIELSTKGKPPVFQRKDAYGDWIIVQKAYIDDTALILDEQEIAAAKASVTGQDGFAEPAVYHLGWADKRLIHTFIRKRANEYDYEETVDGVTLEVTNISDPERTEVLWNKRIFVTGKLNINGEPGEEYEYTQKEGFLDPSDIHRITLDEQGTAAVDVPKGVYWYRSVQDTWNEHTERYEVRKGCVDLGETDFGSRFRIKETEVPADSAYLLQEDREFTVLADKDVYEVTENYVNRSRVQVLFMKYENNDRNKPRNERTAVNGARFDVYALSHDPTEAISSCIVRRRMKAAGNQDLQDGGSYDGAYEACTAAYSGLRGDAEDYGERRASDPHYIGSVLTGAVSLGSPGEVYEVSADRENWQTVQINEEGYAETEGTLYIPEASGKTTLYYRSPNSSGSLSYLPGSVDLSARFADELGLGEIIAVCETEAPSGYSLGGCAVYRLRNDGTFDPDTGKTDDETVILDYFEAGSLHTAAADAEDGDRFIDGSTETIRIRDTVEYTGLQPEKVYHVCGTLHVRRNGEDSGTLKQTDGSDISACSVDFSPGTDGSGRAEVLFEFSSALLTQPDLQTVVFEDLYDGDLLVSTHSDIQDQEQTVRISTFRTEARDASDNDKYLNRTEQAVLTDTVTYSGLIPGDSYLLEGTVHLRRDGEDAGILTIDGEPVRAFRTFIPEQSHGNVDVNFTFDASGIPEGTDLVVFEDLKQGDALLIEHHDIHDEGQTVQAKTEHPALKTYAASTDGRKNVGEAREVQLQDRVWYEHIPAGRKTVLKGSVHIVDGDNNDLGELAAAERTFVPEGSRGLEFLDFTVSTEGLENRRLVVYETMYTEDGEIIAEHADPKDTAQTIYVGKVPEPSGKEPTISTTAYGTKDGRDSVPLQAKVSITDRVEYRSLTPGTTYHLKAEVHRRDHTGKDLGVIAESKQAFTPQNKDGTVYLSAGINTLDLAGSDLVFFEYLYDAEGKLTASHEDLYDQAQSVAVSEEPGKRKDVPWIRTGSGRNVLMYGIMAGVALIALFLSFREKENE